VLSLFDDTCAISLMMLI